jgi:hypothetical protein
VATITEHENEQVEQANSTGLTPVVFIHGLRLLASTPTAHWPSSSASSRRPDRAWAGRVGRPVAASDQGSAIISLLWHWGR